MGADSHAEHRPGGTIAGTNAARLTELSSELAIIVANPVAPLASLSVLAVKNGEVVYQKQFGSKWIDPGHPKENKPADRATTYRIASISKLVTTLGVMRLVEDGKMKLDDDVSDHLGYKLRNPHFPDDVITLRMLLSHTSSLRDTAGYYWEHNQGVDLREVLTPAGRLYGKGAMWASGANARPGAYFSYANLPWGVIATIMERVSGERFDRLMQRLILTPMNLAGGFHPADFSAHDLANVATLYRKRREVGGKEIWDSAGPWVAQVDDYGQTPPEPRATTAYVIGSNGTLFGPQGNCRLSAEGLGSIMLMLMNKGKHQGKQILAEKSVALLMQPQWRNNQKTGMESNGDHGTGRFQAWALGAQIFTDASINGRGDRLVAGGGLSGVGHYGDAWGLRSLLVLNPVSRDGLIFLSGGPGFDPDRKPGKFSSWPRYQEQVLSALDQYVFRASLPAQMKEEKK